jgi:hypothetical protein
MKGASSGEPKGYMIHVYSVLVEIEDHRIVIK